MKWLKKLLGIGKDKKERKKEKYYEEGEKAEKMGKED